MSVITIPLENHVFIPLSFKLLHVWTFPQFSPAKNRIYSIFCFLFDYSCCHYYYYVSGINQWNAETHTVCWQTDRQTGETLTESDRGRNRQRDTRGLHKKDLDWSVIWFIELHSLQAWADQKSVWQRGVSGNDLIGWVKPQWAEARSHGFSR